MAEALARVNDPILGAVRRLALDLYGSDTPAAVERVTYAVVDLPGAALRRHLLAGTLSDAALDSLTEAVCALVAAPLMNPE